MIETYKLTEEDIRNANAYVPLATKMEFVRYVAERCFDQLEISTNNGGKDKNSPLPSCYKVNTDKKTRYLMAALVGLYLGKKFKREEEKTEHNPDPDKWLMAIDEYDIYAGGHIFDQLNRMKNNVELRDKCFDIQADYSDLKYRLESDIKGLLGAMNDSASRLMAYIELASSPDEIKKAMDAMTENQEMLDQYLAGRDANLDHAIAELENDLPEENSER